MNIANEADVKKREEEFKSKKKLETAQLRILLAQKPVRDFVWSLLEEAKVFNSIWEQSARIHYNAGKQDFGHYLMGRVCDADEEAFFAMMRENKDKKEEKSND